MSSQSIDLTIVNDTGEPLTIIEKIVWYESKGGEWNEANDAPTFTMNGDRGSGLIRFKESNGQIFSVVIGKGYQGWWCDVQTNLDVTDTGIKLLPEYYRNGGKYSTESHEKITRYTSAGRMVKLEFWKFWAARLEYYLSKGADETPWKTRPDADKKYILSR